MKNGFDERFLIGCGIFDVVGADVLNKDKRRERRKNMHSKDKGKPRNLPKP